MTATFRPSYAIPSIDQKDQPDVQPVEFTGTITAEIEGEVAFDDSGIIAAVDLVQAALAAGIAVTVGGQPLSVTVTNPGSPTDVSALLTQADFDTKTGSLTETAPTTDTASSGLNGRLQRIAQNITLLRTSLVALLPGSLGQKARTASFAVTLSTEDVTTLTPPAAITGYATSANQATEIASLASIDGGIPAALGQTTKSASMPVTLASDTGTLPVSAASLPLPTGAATETTLGSRLSESDFDTKVGSLTETAPVSDTASSGLNGRLQRIAQRLTSVIALMPASLGQKARAASYAVTLSTEDVTALTPPAAITGFATAANQTTELASLASIDAGVPAALGQTTKSASMPVTIASDQALVADPTTPSTLVAFVTSVPTAGTRVQLASNAVKAGILQAPSTNTGLIYVGVVTVSGTVFGAELQAGQATGIAIDNTNKIYIDASVNGDKCAFLGSN